MIAGRRGIALLVTVGILVLLALAGTAMAAMAGQLRTQAAARLDEVEAGFLSRSGVEYASARLFQDPAVPASADPDTQCDDWTFRDERGTPLEKARNPSYARTEPYADRAAPGSGAGAGRYDEGVDSYADVNGNGRFDSWSGRLRGRCGMTGSAFALKISGENAAGAFNVNTGCPDATDLNPRYPLSGTGNGIPDYCDLGSKASLPLVDAAPDYVDAGGQHLRIPKELAGPIGKALEAVNPGVDLLWNPDDLWARNRRLAFTLNQLGLILGLAAPRPGDAIVRNRPPGGYRDVDEMAALFLPVDWSRLRPHLAVAGRRNWCAPWDLRYLLNAPAAAPEAVAAAFSGVGLYRQQLLLLSAIPYAGDEILPLEALRLANFLKSERIESRYDLFLKLLEHREELFPVAVPDLRTGGVDARTADDIRRGKALLAQALAVPEASTAYPTTVLFPEYRSWITYDTAEHWLSWNSRDVPGRGQKEQSLNDEGSARGAADLGFGPSSLLSILSVGKVSGSGGGPLALAHASGSYVEGRIVAQAQDDFENLTVDPVRKLRLPGRRFEGGTIAGRPVPDRASSFPCFSRGALADLPVDTPGYGYPAGSGEVMLLDRPRADPDAVFFLPLWDDRQPERPAPAAQDLTVYRLFQDTGGAFNWRRFYGSGDQLVIAKQAALTVLATPLRVWAFRSGSGQPLGFAWIPDGYVPGPDQNGGRPFWVDDAGNVESGTAAFCGGEFRLYQVAKNGITGSRTQWQESGPGFTTHAWSNPVPVPSPQENRDHVAFKYAGHSVAGYLNGIPVGSAGFDPFAWDPASAAMFWEGDPLAGDLAPVAFWFCPEALDDVRIAKDALGCWFWTAGPDRPIPSFTSPLYQFDGPARLLDVQWDGFVPKRLRDAAGNTVPLRVELLLYRDAGGGGEPLRVPLPPDSWKTGGTRLDFLALWRAVHPDPSEPLPRVQALRYRVWLDASGMDAPQKTPVFDAIEIGFAMRSMAGIRVW